MVWLMEEVKLLQDCLNMHFHIVKLVYVWSQTGIFYIAGQTDSDDPPLTYKSHKSFTINMTMPR